ncbi:MAG: DegT/DnrJ/EryC1/StrS family aminotransferase [Planctomycetaceae bacterium]
MTEPETETSHENRHRKLPPARREPDVFCWLKQTLRPPFRAVAVPIADEHLPWQFHYRVLQGNEVCQEFCGDFRQTSPAELMQQVRSTVGRLQPECLGTNAYRPADTIMSHTKPLPIASRLLPKTDRRTWFSSGRAAFAWLLQHVVRPTRIWLPTYVSPSLIDTLESGFSGLSLEFYPVDMCEERSDDPNGQAPRPKSLHVCLPDVVETDAVVQVHYFGHRFPQIDCSPAVLLDDFSHSPLPEWLESQDLPNDQSPVRRWCYGSLRKAYRVADGGCVSGCFCPLYEADAHEAAWLRLHADDWTDLREAESCMERTWKISDISSQSLAVILQTDEQRKQQARRQQQHFLQTEFPVGECVVDFGPHETPLLHLRLMSSRDERDDLKSFLANDQVFTSIHWPLHRRLRNQDRWDVRGAERLADCSLAVPICEDFTEEQLHRICESADRWKRAGASRFPDL